MAAQRLGKRVLSKLQAPSRARGPGGSPGGLQKRHARVTVKYDRRELQRRLDVEKWIDGRLEELYRGRVRRRGVGGTDGETPGEGKRDSGCMFSLMHPDAASFARENAASWTPGPRRLPSMTLCLCTQTRTWVQTPGFSLWELE